jgi:hypothetical protein
MKTYELPTENLYVPRRTGLEAAVESDPLSLLNASRVELARAKVSLLCEQMDKRREAHGENLTSIATDELDCRNEQIKREAVRDYEGALKIQLDSMMRLRKERRAEVNDYMRDFMRFSRDLVEAVMEYKSVVSRGDVFDQLERR